VSVGAVQGDAQSAPAGAAYASNVSNNKGDDGSGDAGGDAGGDAVGDGVDPYHWNIEGVEGRDDGEICHMNAFYALLKKWFRKKEHTSVLSTKKDNDAIVNYLLLLKQGDTDCREGYFSGNYNAMSVPLALKRRC
jgi:hypothetical protein